MIINSINLLYCKCLLRNQIKGIDASVEPREIKEALEELGYSTKDVTNIFNKTKYQCLWLNWNQIQKNFEKTETHPIYSMKYLLHRRLTGGASPA